MDETPKENAAPVTTPGPVGGLGVDVRGRTNHKSNSDARILARALRERWPLSPEMRKDAIARLHAIIQDGQASNRDLVMAVKALISADALNVAEARESSPSGGVTLHVQTVVVDGHTPKTRVVEGEACAEVSAHCYPGNSAQGQADPPPPSPPGGPSSLRDGTPEGANPPA